MKNKHLIVASAEYFARENGYVVSEWTTCQLLKFAALDIVPKRHSNILFEAIDSISLSDLEFGSLIEIISYQIDIYALEMTAENIKYCVDYVQTASERMRLIESEEHDFDDILSTHYNAYNKSQTSGEVIIPFV